MNWEGRNEEARGYARRYYYSRLKTCEPVIVLASHQGGEGVLILHPQYPTAGGGERSAR